MNHNCSIHHKDSAMFLENERKTKVVAFISLITMVVEIIVGHWSGSMALLADGWHMASHTMALGLTLIVYYLYRHPKFKQAFSFGGGKILSLGGYTSALLLVLISFSMIYESSERLFSKNEIHFNEAIIVAIVGLIINLICVYILHQSDSHTHHHHHNHSHTHHHHDHSHHHHDHKCDHHHSHTTDHNHKSAYIHILTDALTSVLAIIALVLGKYYSLNILDSVVGILGGFVVLKWSISLIKESGMDLLDAHDFTVDKDELLKKIEADGSKVLDIHLWKLSPHQVGCEMIIESQGDQKSSYYRDIILSDFAIHHLIIEVV